MAMYYNFIQIYRVA